MTGGATGARDRLAGFRRPVCGSAAAVDDADARARRLVAVRRRHRRAEEAARRAARASSAVR